MHRRTALTFMGACLLPGLGTPASAATGRNPRILVGFAAGGSSDIMARLMADKLSSALGGSFIVINKPGANGNIAAAEVARAEPDGATFYLGSFNNPVNQAADRKLPFDFMRDFVPVGTISYLSNVLLVSNRLPVGNVQELLDYARKNPGKVSFGSSGAGSSQHMSGELFKYLGKVDLNHIPYNGSAPAMTDLIGGQIDMLFDNMPTALAQVKAGRVKALAVTSKARAPQLPDVPTVAEAGLPDFEVRSFFALYAPKGTPGAQIASVNAAMNRALQEPSVRQRLLDVGAEAAGGSPEQLRALTESEVKKWRNVIREAGIQLLD
ncbi:Bug family tripartite tricarboxylate transporter substrate binding protein [Pigmentiphaga litoralis]|uniref:Bug family tripartite tricarboxylate transporter substrate binding protein n=1 Tax=Pigmentiphaga litoralis TaxID=516702 RepID=UPI003B428AAF